MIRSWFPRRKPRMIRGYFGLLRFYSLADLILLLAAAGAGGRPLWGAVLLHIGFLGYLESRHRHPHRNRAQVREGFAWGLFLIGWVLFGRRTEGAWYVLFSIFYSLKNRGCWWGLVSPAARGLQHIALLMAITNGPLVWVAGVLMAVRNLLGDFRDVEQDREEGLKTWPVMLGVKTNWIFMHPIAMVITTWSWWAFSSLPIWVPGVANIIEVFTYWLTPRPSNKKALAKLAGLARRLGFR